MHSSKIRRKFQPRISKSNSAKITELPGPIRTLTKNVSIDQLENFSRSRYFTIFYVLDESSDSSKGKLIPLRDEERNFCVILLRK